MPLWESSPWGSSTVKTQPDTVCECKNHPSKEEPIGKIHRRGRRPA